MAKADIVQLQENGEPKYVATHANAVEGLSEFIQRDYNKLGNTEKIYVSGGRGDNSLADGSENRPYRTIQAAVDSLPLVSGTKFYIFIEAGVYLEDVVIQGIKSQSLSLISTKSEAENASEENTSVLARSIKFIDCTMYCLVRGVTLTDPQNSSEDSFINALRCSYVWIDNCRATVNTKSVEGKTEKGYSAIFAEVSSVLVSSTMLSNQNNALQADRLSNVKITSTNMGTNNATGIFCISSFVFGTGYIEATTVERKAQGGQIFS